VSLATNAGVADAIRYGSGPTRLRARWVVPIDMPPIENGEIVCEEGTITYVGRFTGIEPYHDFGNAVILPGFVNVHAHLEYTVMRGLLEDMEFFPWIRTLTALKAHLDLDDWVTSATLGAAEMMAAGITTVADASDAGASLTALAASGQRGVVYREVFGIEKEPTVETTLGLLTSRLVAMRAQLARTGADQRIRLGISPHAPYTVRPELFGALARYAYNEHLPQVIHLGESVAEEQLIREGTGPFAEMFERRGIEWATPGVSPTKYLDDCGALTRGTVVVHTVHLNAEDAALLKEAGCSVAHCPKSNGKLGAGVAPVRALLDAGLAVGLGTDSVASNNTADIFEEMRHAIFNAREQARDVRALSAKEVLHMATLGGATALGMEGEIGSIARGKKADLCVVRLDGLHVAPADDNPINAVVFSCRASDVALTMVGGKVVYEGGWHILLDVSRLRQAVAEDRKRLQQEVARTLGAAQ
jgi:cytosine/adenosine deaminase-related metal-dependent hydrolase